MVPLGIVSPQTVDKGSGGRSLRKVIQPPRTPWKLHQGPSPPHGPRWGAWRVFNDLAHSLVEILAPMALLIQAHSHAMGLWADRSPQGQAKTLRMEGEMVPDRSVHTSLGIEVGRHENRPTARAAMRCRGLLPHKGLDLLGRGFAVLVGVDPVEDTP